MALITRCPNCATTFRVTPLHLQAHGGDVRCGRCAQIFNGFASLATMQEPEAADLPKTTVADTPDNTSEAESVKNLPFSPSPLSDQEVSPPAPSHKIAETITQEVPDPDSSAAGEPAPQIWDAASAPENYMPESAIRPPSRVACISIGASMIKGFARILETTTSAHASHAESV